MHESHSSYTAPFWNLPDSQCRQLVSPVWAAIVPLAQPMHVWLVLGWYLPTGQSVHVEEDTDAYLPSAHVVQASAL